VSDEPTPVVICRSYTHARRHPLVLGRIGGFTLPTPLSPAQLAVLVGSFLVLLGTADAWGWLLPGVARLLVMIVVPLALTWALRHLRFEGRSPVRMLLGLLSLATQPRNGVVRGRAVRRPADAPLIRARLRVVNQPCTEEARDHPLLRVAPGARGWSCLNPGR